MSIVQTPPPIKTLADLIQRLGGIPLDRIRFHPAPGTATERDVVEVERREERLCELVDGVLVEKTMGYRESVLAMSIGRMLGNFVAPRKLGLVSGEAGMSRIFPGLIRIPDVAFVSWGRVPGGVLPRDPIPDLVPDLAVEVLSRGNTEPEMERKRSEYFSAGVRLVWMVDPEARTVAVYKGPDQVQTLTESEVLDGGDVLPGFRLAVRDIFAG
ncbi:MAG: Uma2 family endonuclease [Planctomycetes bacterium]|nr:Uma2 family endonuclease [Planctomycetota bacterium]